LLEEAKEDPWLSDAVPAVQANLVGQQITVQTQTQTQTQIQTQLQQQLQIELQQELQSYGGGYGYPYYRETPWNEALVRAPEFPHNISFVRPFCNLLQNPMYQQPYHQIFDGDLLITENLAHTKRILLPVFHEKQKEAGQHLVFVKDGRVQLLMLSLADAAFFQKYLEKYQPQDMWLIHASGREISSHDHLALSSDEQRRLSRALLQVAVFNGNTSYLDVHYEQTLDWLQEANEDLKLRFLSLKVERKQTEREIFYHSILPLVKEASACLTNPAAT